MKLVVGLGNPDKEYENTFHNLGFMCADRVAYKLNVQFKNSKFKALIGETRIGTEKIIIAKPLTYMNLSGEAVKELLDYYKISTKDMIVAYDDFDLAKGNIRIRESGSSGTHNGMRNIIANINTEDFARIRVGFKPEDGNKIPLINLVLMGISEQDKTLFSNAVDRASDAIIDFINGKDFQYLMQKYNGKVN